MTKRINDIRKNFHVLEDMLNWELGKLTRKNGRPYDIKNPPEEVLVRIVKRNWHFIEDIENPSEAVGKAAIETSMHAIWHINNPSEEIQVEIVKKIPEYIRQIKDPSEAVQMAAVQQDAYVFRYIKNPTDCVIRKALEISSINIKHVKDQTEELQLLCVEKDYQSIQSIKKPTAKVVNIVLKKDPNLIRIIPRHCLRTLDEDTAIQIVKRYFYSLRFIPKHLRTEKVNEAAFSNSVAAITWIKNPTEKMKLEAVEERPALIAYIARPSSEIQLIAATKDPGLVQRLPHKFSKAMRELSVLF